MNVECVSKKDSFKNLTVNKQYEATEDGDVYVLPNDAGYSARYAKKYFRAVPAVPVRRNLTDMLNVSVDDDIVTIRLNRTVRTVNLNIDQAINSCGIFNIDGIQFLKRTVREMYAAKARDIIGEESEMFEEIIKGILDYLCDSRPAMCYTFSDAVRDEDASLDQVLDSLSDSVVEGDNPNSDHDIVLWIIKPLEVDSD